MKHIWISNAAFDEDGEWQFHMSFGPADCDDSTSVASAAQFEMDDLRISGIKAKFGPAPKN
jgi:hypothetical protein